jgi:nitric oxide reductase NorD protein
MTAVRLVRIEQRLEYFLRGLSGGSLELKAGDAAWTDGSNVFLPRLIDEFAPAERNADLYLLKLALLWAQTRFGTFAVDLAPALASRAAHGDRERAAAWLACLENQRLEGCLARELPGLATRLAPFAAQLPDDLAAARTRLLAPQATVGDSLALLPFFLDRAPPRLPQDVELRPWGIRAPRLPSAVGSTGQEGIAMPVLSGERGHGDTVAGLGPPAGHGAWRPLPEVATELPPDDEPPDAWLDEWDHRHRAYRQRRCRLFLRELPADDADFVREVRQRQAPLIRELRRRFEALRPADAVQLRVADGEDIDLDALVLEESERLAGIPPDGRTYRRRRRDERSLAALFLVDMSGSTWGWVNDVEREALVMLGEALKALGDDYAIFGFSGFTHRRCDFYRIKDFGDRWDVLAQARVSAVEAKESTRLGAPIRYAARLLAAAPARHRLLMVISDGQPDDRDDGYRGPYGIEDTRHALQEAKRRGIHTHCITVDRHGADYLPHLFGKGGFTVIDDPRRLPLRIASIYARLAGATR